MFFIKVIISRIQVQNRNKIIIELNGQKYFKSFSGLIQLPKDLEQFGEGIFTKTVFTDNLIFPNPLSNINRNIFWNASFLQGIKFNTTDLEIIGNVGSTPSSNLFYGARFHRNIIISMKFKPLEDLLFKNCIISGEIIYI